MYNWKKGIAKWVVGDTLYLSVPFTWLVEEAEKEARQWKGKVLMGGPGLMKPSECEGFEPILFHNPCATFTTRGCPNKCSFCAVPKLEGEFRELAAYRLAPIICDNNLLAASFGHLNRLVDKLKKYRLVDFNQGLEARRFTPEVADLLGNLRCIVRFAFDYWGIEGIVKDAIDLCQERTTKDIRVYCLTGYNDTPESARARLELVRSWGVYTSPMRYQPLDAKEKNDYLAEGWTERDHINIMRYYSRLAWLGHIPFEEYNRVPKEQLPLIE